METRAFNSIFVDPCKGILTKTSSNLLKLQDEINYYLKLPNNIVGLFPKFIDYNENSYTIEYVPYKSLAELIEARALSFSEAKNILNKLFDILAEIHATKLAELEVAIINKNFLIQKTIDRVALLKKDSLSKHLTEEPLIINDKLYQNFSYYQEQFARELTQFFTNYPVTTIIHGDFSFSNILYCPKNKDIKLIDPRGSFGSQGIYGHPYYDYAKLMHCAHGNYDAIVGGNFKLTEKTPASYDLEIATSPILKKLYRYFRNLLLERSFNVEILHLIEASLFLSMTPLHYEDPKRQQALFLNGLILMNNFFEGRYASMH